MRLRTAIIALIATTALLAPGSGLAQIESLSITQAKLGPKGATVIVTLTVSCQPGYNVAFGVSDRRPINRAEAGSGQRLILQPLPGRSVHGQSQAFDVEVPTFTSFAFKQGKATASGNLTVFNPETFQLLTESTGPLAIRIRK
jgi:hypothetical protein